MSRACKNIYTQADDYQCEHHVTNKINNYKHMKIILQISLILIFTTQIYSQNKILKLYSNNGNKLRNFTLTEIDSITFGVTNPCPGIDSLTYSGKTYHTVQIGSQCWLEENLDVGTMIMFENPSSSVGNNQTNNGIIEKYCYTDDAFNCEIYGGLYQWNEAMQYVTTEGAQGICPTGWHIPTSAEFNTLKTSAGSYAPRLIDGSQELSGTQYVTQNETGFSALFAGYKGEGRVAYHYISSYAVFWNSSGTNFALQNDFAAVTISSSLSTRGYSVRCIKD